MWMPLRIKEAVEIARNRRAIRCIDRAYDVELAKAKTANDRENVENGRHWETSLHLTRSGRSKREGSCAKRIALTFLMNTRARPAPFGNGRANCIPGT
jgi:hypothetical protein